jgi:hypothetical protein
MLGGCSSGISESDLIQLEYEQNIEDQYEPTEEQLRDEADAAYEEYLAENSRWTCFYDPTMNENWHDDVLCTNISSSLRPLLLLDDPFIEYEEIMRAAAEHESSLNR